MASWLRRNPFIFLLLMKLQHHISTSLSILISFEEVNLLTKP